MSDADSSKLGVNEAGTPGKSDTPLTQPRSGPVLYELIDKDGNVPVFKSLDGTVARNLTFETAQAAGDWARRIWPDQEQDEDRTGKGWDVQVVGAK